MINDGMLKKNYKRYSIVLLSILVTLTCISKLSDIFLWAESYEWKYYILPVIWLCIIVFIVLYLPKIHPLIKLSKQDYIYFDALACAMILIAIQYIVALLIYEVGKSPYDLSPKGIGLNILSVVLPFLGIELIRGYVLGSFRREKNIAFFLCITLLISFIELNTQKLNTIKDLELLTIYLAKDVGPVLCKNIIMSYLALYGGATAAIVFGGLLLIFHWFFPILPQLNWLSDGIIGIMVPILEIMFIINKYEKIYINRRQAKCNKKESLSWIATLTFSIVMIWFVVGVFPIYPSVIVTGSMKPLINPGDVVLVKQFYTEEDIKALQAGDIILFQRDDIRITHRIIENIYDENGNLSFRTKGDNNSAEDIRIVLPQEVKGKYVTVIPKIGYPSLWLKSNSIEDREDVEY